MAKSICIECSYECVTLKTGFYHRQDDGLTYDGDLFGCKRCGHYQLHGIPNRSHIFHNLIGTVSGTMVEDPKNGRYRAILNPMLIVTPEFVEHMKRWYPDWNHPLPLIEETKP